MCEAYDRENLYTEYHPKVQAYIGSRVKNVHDAEDLVSQVFLKVYHNLESFDSRKASVSTWIYTITRNTVTDFFRTQRQNCQLEEEVPSPGNVEDGLLRDELLEELASALEKLEERERDIIVLHYYSEKTLVDIAVLMNLSYPYVKVLHKKAVKALRDRMHLY
ncbi:MAG: sigma-70 family RNA polymerase sigma factor [Clostridiales bacterium]|nr:sigma-70 family RNA polymerase sigma factor [Clostridiales bacterium]